MCIPYVTDWRSISHVGLFLCLYGATSCVLADDQSQPKARLNPEAVRAGVSNEVLYPGMPSLDRYRIVRNKAAGTRTISRQDISRIDEVVQGHNRELETHWRSLYEMLLDLADTNERNPVLKLTPDSILGGVRDAVLLDSSMQTGMVWKRWGIANADGIATERFAYFRPETKERSSEISRGSRVDDTFFSDRYTQHIDGRDSWITKMSDGSGNSSVLVHHVVRNAQGTLVRDKFFREGRAGEELPLWE